MSDPNPSDPATPFHSLAEFAALPRVNGLALSLDGARLVVSVATPDRKGTRYASALWEVDPAGTAPARRLTRSARGEGGAAFLPDGSLLFVSGRPDPESDDDDGPASLWMLPATGGEARVVGRRAGGFDGIAVAREAGTVVVGSATLPAAVTAEDDEERRTVRKDRKITAVLHESAQVRYWDHDLGPARRRLLVGVAPDAADAAGERGLAAEPTIGLHDLTGHVGPALGEDNGWDVTPDGRTVVATWTVAEPAGSQRTVLAALDVPTAGSEPVEPRVLLDDVGHEYTDPVVSPDGGRVAVLVHRRSGPADPPDSWLGVLDLGTGELRDAAPGWDRWPAEAPVWLPDGSALLVTADEDGRSPVFRIAGGAVTRLTTDDGAYTGVRVAPDGTAYALRATVDSPPAPVRFDPVTPGEPVALRGPVAAPALPGRLEEVTATADDGSRVRGWLALPAGASAADPVPLLLWIHGGPLASTNSWSWRWNPWVMVARGYAVLMPDPALSTGYGLDFIRRGWGRWGAEPYTDLLAITDVALERPDLDADRTAAMGGSFGGYMANWVAGHTDRFRGIVTHASLWALEGFGRTTDAPYYWRREMTAQMEAEHSPHLAVDKIVTPMLVIHGDKDYRVPIGEALRLWTDLQEFAATPEGAPDHKFLYFPDENHWVLTPQHAEVWYETVLNFLATTVHGEPWRTPELLR